MRRMILACSVLLALSTGATAGQIYKWVDAQGNVHFGSQPPEGQEASEVNPNINQPRLAPAATVPSGAAEEEADQEKLDQQVKQEIAQQEAERKKYCETIRRNLAQLENNPRVRVEDKGETRRLKEEERQARIAETEKAIADNCK